MKLRGVCSYASVTVFAKIIQAVRKVLLHALLDIIACVSLLHWRNAIATEDYKNPHSLKNRYTLSV